MDTKIAEEIQPHRKADHEIDALFLNRWSPRAFSSEPLDDVTLNRVFEAARWAPSSMNEQPWRFIIARSAEDRARFVEFLMPPNQAWAKDAPVLVVIVAKTTFSHNGSPNPVAAFDAGCAWGFLSLAAVQQGLITHGMAGFYKDQAATALELPEDYEAVAVIALGKRGNTANLSEQLREREKPSGRRSLEETVMEGRFKAPA